MAEDLRDGDTGNDRIAAAHAALIIECKREEENCLYTSTTFFIWLKCLRAIRLVLWVSAIIASGFAASQLVRADPAFRLWAAAAALAATVLPGIGRVMKIDAAIDDYSKAATALKTLQGEFRRAANVWSQKAYQEFEQETRKLIKELNGVHKLALTPPEICFSIAKRKIEKGHYTNAPDMKPSVG